MRTRQTEWEEQQTYVHLLFSMSDAGTMKVSLSKIGKRAESRVYALNDLFSQGPLWNLEEEAGRRQRMEWMLDHSVEPVCSHSYRSNHEGQIESMIDLLQSVPESKHIIIWHSDNAHEQVGLRFALHVLRERKTPVHTINVSQYEASYEPFLPKVYAFGQLKSEDVQGLLESAGDEFLLQEGERRRLEAEWKELAEGGGTLRLWEDGRIVTVPEDSLDERLIRIIEHLEAEKEQEQQEQEQQEQEQQEQDLEELDVKSLLDKMQEEDDMAQGENRVRRGLFFIGMSSGHGQNKAFVRAGRVVQETEKWGQLIGYSYIEYRLWTLISDGVLEFSGLPGAMYRYSVRVKK
ncbi:DUF1835 domain-containing protein [Paenibacillus swuensis]|uniref:DUF1835 domain-containing protein n=1 Tax=Paenibacillus swuensis TaxID=1178515 RepID=UPI001E5F0A15|nr:DUF1835 domain-containing protein [Paenibacillus swuensis]